MFIFPLKKNIANIIEDHIDKAGLYEIEGIMFHIDIQNITLSRFDPKFTEQFFNDYNPVEHLENFLMYLVRITNLIGQTLNLPVAFNIYTDTGRNLFNQNFISKWKEDRKKSYEKLRHEDIVSYQYLSFSKAATDSLYNVLYKLLNHSNSTRFFILSGIDSDFIPYTFYLMHNKKDKTKVLHVLLSMDHDYNHIISETDEIIRYLFLQKRKVLKESDIEHRYNIHYSVMKRYGIKDQELGKFVSKYYQVFHSLIGDNSDSIKTLIPRKGIMYWSKKLYKDGLPEIDEIRRMILDDECFIPELLDYESDFKDLGRGKTKWDDFKMRMFIVDFYFTSNFMLSDIYEDSKEIYKKFIDRYPYQKQILEENKRVFNNVIETKPLDRNTVFDSLIKLGIDNSKAMDITETLF